MTNLIDLTGQTFQRWTVLRRAENGGGGQPRWWCRCVCGTERAVFSQSLREGHTQGCGCHRARNRVGEVYGALTVTRRAGRTAWECQCATGHVVSLTVTQLRAALTCPVCDETERAARVADLRARYVERGESLEVIAAAYDVNLTTVAMWMRNAGIPRRRKGAPKGPRASSRPKCDLAVERYRNGETSVAIGRDLGVDPSSVTRWAKRAGVEPHPMGRAPKRHPVAAEVIDNVVARINTSAPAQTPRDLVLDLHAQGVARKTIAHDLGLSVETVGRWIADADRERITRIRAMAHAGVPHAAIAEAFGVSCAYVGLLAREGRERAA